ncbi:MAG: TonB-dependent receptor [Pseudomonadota bacterium]|nr:TonB-dependent receptor [Pseudomonadota bacterium]MEC9300397.1 TonB-dependent receptor [Pseudomonadota bacterium]
MKYKFDSFVRLTSVTALLFSSVVFAQQDEPEIEEIHVWGRSLQLLGSADSASQGVVGYDDFSTRPLARVAELVEVIPGMIATQHSGPGKANQYFLRGFNLDHGSDFSTYFDGMPVNWRTHAHAQGYMDLNFIIPELIQRLDFQKGPYFANTGDFSLAGSNRMVTYDTLEEGFSELTLGSRNETRLLTANSFEVGDGDFLYAIEHLQTNGFFDLEQDVRKYNAFLKYTGDIFNIPSRITFSAYDSIWTSTNQIPERAVKNGLIDRFGFIDPDLGGDSYRYSLTGSFELNNWELNLYTSSYYMSLINNPTYFLNDSINGDEFEQEDERILLGGSLVNEVETEIFGLPVTRTIGADLRYDDVSELNLFYTVSRNRIESLREDEAQQLSLGSFADLQFSLTDRLRASVGLRLDFYDFEVDALRAQNSGSKNESLWQPKVNIAYEVNENLELYANYGEGFHSNDARAAINTIDPATGNPSDTLDILVQGEGSELGFRYDTLEGFNFSVAWFELDLDSELVFVGDAGTTEPSDPSRRNGIELSSFWEFTEELVFDFTASKSDGHFRGLPSGENSIPDAHDLVVAAGLTYHNPNGWTSSLRVRHFDDAALTEDESVKKDSSTLVHFGVSYAQESWELGLDIINLLDQEDDDIAYWFESRMIGETASFEDIHFHPSNPRAVRALLKYKF